MEAMYDGLGESIRDETESELRDVLRRRASFGRIFHTVIGIKARPVKNTVGPR